jgi:chromosome partitioning protein
VNQIKIAILANAGGVGKTTLASNLAHHLARNKISVAVIDLDPQRSLDTFCGLAEVEAEWSLNSPWGDNSIGVCQSHPTLSQTAQELVTRKRGEYVLADRLEEHPLSHQVVLMDCPATYGMLCENAIAAATHLLIPIQLEVKAIAGLNDLIVKVADLTKALKLKPAPEMLGLVPSLYNKDVAMHRQYLDELPEIAKILGTKAYPPIRLTAEFKNACAFGLPLSQHRPGHPANRDLNDLTTDISKLVGAKK